jgi:chromosome partitioning protein
MRVIAFLNQKGGVGKTTTAVNVGIGLVRLGRSVVLADLDPQGHLTRSLGAEPGGDALYELMKGSRTLRETLAPVEGAWLVPASLELSGADTEFATRPGKERLVAQALSPLSGLTGLSAGTDRAGADALILDCPPNLGLLTVNALAMAGEVVIPVQAEYLALASLGGLMDTLEAARSFNPGLRILGIVLTRYNHRKRLCREVAGAIRSHFPDLLLETRIRESVALAEAPGFGQSIFAYAPKSQGAIDFTNLSREIDAWRTA